MRKKAKSLLKIAAIYLGTILGAGFASGQELVLFFARFGKRGLLGCMLSGILFCVLGAAILSKAYPLKKKTHHAYLQTIFNPRAAALLALTTELFLGVSFCVMLSAAGAFFKEHLGWPAWSGVLSMSLFCLCIISHGVNGLSAASLLLTPFMLVGIVYISLYTILGETTVTWLPQVHHGAFLPYTLFYVGYNLLTATAVLVPSASLASDPKTAARGGILGGLCLSIMALLCTLALFFHPELWNNALPLLVLSRKAGKPAYIIYAIVLYMAMLTTALSTGFSITERLISHGMKQKTAARLVCFSAIPLAFIEFSILVRHCYVVFGILGFVLICGILWDLYKSA